MHNTAYLLCGGWRGSARVSWPRHWSTGRAWCKDGQLHRTVRRPGPAGLGGRLGRGGVGRPETSATHSRWTTQWSDWSTNTAGVRNWLSTGCSLGGSKWSARTWPPMYASSGTPMARSLSVQTPRRGQPRCGCSPRRWSADSTKKSRMGPSIALSSSGRTSRAGEKARAVCRAAAHATRMADALAVLYSGQRAAERSHRAKWPGRGPRQQHVLRPKPPLRAAECASSAIHRIDCEYLPGRSGRVRAIELVSAQSGLVPDRRFVRQ